MALDQLEATLKKQWRLGQSIVLCWAFDPNGLLTIVVPHYFLGNFTSPNHPSGEGQNNEDFIRQLISGSRFKAHDEIFENAGRLGVAPSFIKLDSPLDTGEASIEMIDEMIKRYSVGHEESRAVALFDIADFSLFRPFEQASQLNSLSYSMNSAYSKLKREGVEVNFARTTTGDGYYVWNRDLGAFPNVDLLTFFLLVLIDNAVAREKSQVGTVPTLRSAFHIGSHYELSQAEGINPTVFSYIVGDVTIKLARLIDSVPPAGIHIGDFTASLPDVDTPVGPAEFLRYSRDELLDMSGLRIDEKQLSDIRFESWSAGQSEERLIKVTDKHGMSQGAHNVGFAIELEGLALALGMRNR
ncbi:MAG TPA: hypothetical protein DEX20_07055 [Halieaceae bacterium]|nr:hypothetical protein [Halieaceae bacterium]